MEQLENTSYDNGNIISEDEANDIYYLGSLKNQYGSMSMPQVDNFDTSGNKEPTFGETIKEGVSAVGTAINEQQGTLDKIGEDTTKGMIKGGDKGLTQTLKGVANLAGQPVDIVNEYAVKPALEYLGLPSSDEPFMGTKMTTELMDSFINITNKVFPKLISDPINESLNEPFNNETYGKLVEGISQFGITAVPAAKLVSMMSSANPFVRGMAWGGIADYMSMNPEDPTATEMLLTWWQGADPKERSDWANNAIAVVQKNDTDGEATKRLKNMLDGALIGGGAEGLIQGILKASTMVPWKQLLKTVTPAAAGGITFSDDAEGSVFTPLVKAAAKEVLPNTVAKNADNVMQVDDINFKPDIKIVKEVLDKRAEQMKLKPGERLQPSNDNIFKTEIDDYNISYVDQIETPVPRSSDTNITMPKNNRSAAVIKMSDKIAESLSKRLIPVKGSNVQYFYNTAPLITKAIELGIPKEVALKQLKKFALNYAATSPRTQTEQNLRNASLVSTKQNLDVPLDQKIGVGSDGVNEKGYPMMINPGGIHKILVDSAASNKGINYDTNPKPATFAENVSGNLEGVTVDTHAIRAVFDVMNEIEPGSIPIDFILPKFRDQYLKDPTSLKVATMIDDTLGSQMVDGVKKQTEYAVFSDIYKKVAKLSQVKPAEAQSLSWFANGDKTGLGSAPKTIVELIDERVDVTAQLLNKSKEEVFKLFMQGGVPLASFGGFSLLDSGAMMGEEPSST